MNNKMLHRGPMDRLTTTINNLPILSTCVLLLIQFQIFHALPAAPSLSPVFSENSRSSISSGASFPSTSYGTGNSYRSYRPGTRLDNSYRPYSAYFSPKDGPTSGLYAPETSHPNSIYSRQSSTSSAPTQEDIDKVLRYIQREIVTSDFKAPEKKVTTSNNRPRLQPLPSVDTAPVSSKPEIPTAEETKLEPLPTNPIPPPFAPELDPLYERRQYGLGALSLLEQAGPFW